MIPGQDAGASSVFDLDCGEGKLLRMLLKERQFTRIVGLDVSHRALEIAAENLHDNRLLCLHDKVTALPWFCL